MNVLGAAGRIRTVRRWILTAFTFALPIFFLPNITYDPHDLPKLALLLAVTSLATGLRVAEGALTRDWTGLNRAAVPAAAIAVPVTISWVFSTYREWSIFGAYSRWQGLIPYLAVAALAVLVADDFRGRARELAWSMTAAAGVVGGYGFMQTLGIDPLPLPDSVGYTGSTIGNTNFAGGFLGITLPVCAVVWGTGGKDRLPAMACTILCALGLIFTNSQGGWAAALAGLAVVAGASLAVKRAFASRASYIVAGAVIAVVVGSVVVAFFIGNPSAGPIIGGTARYRAIEWANAVEVAADRPVTGWGPNVYALEGTRYRSLENVITSEFGKADDPHSLPLAWSANLGVLGLSGFVVIVVWLVRRGRRYVKGLTSATAFVGCAVAYLVQSLVSIDEIPIRVTFWIAVGALASLPSTEEEATNDGGASDPGWPRKLIAAVVAMVGIVLGTWWGLGFILADARVNSGVAHFDQDEITAGSKSFELALAFREEFRYREFYSEALGAAALDEGLDGSDLISRMRRTDRYLRDFPETIALRKSARIMHYWGQFDPDADEEALVLAERALSYDPKNPLTKVLAAEILIDLERPAEAVALLEPPAAQLGSTIEDVWATLSFAYAEQGDIASASHAASIATKIAPDGCRSILASEFVRLHRQDTPPDKDFPRFHLAITCDAGFFEFFLDHIPARTREFYS